MITVTLHEQAWPEDTEHSWAFPDREAARAFEAHFYVSLELEVARTPGLRGGERLMLTLDESSGTAVQPATNEELFEAWLRDEKAVWL